MKYLKIVILFIVLILIGYFYKMNYERIKYYSKKNSKESVILKMEIDDEKTGYYSNERPREDIISELEVYQGVKEELFTVYYSNVKRMLAKYPEWKEARVGDIILVEDYSRITKDEDPYYYIVNAKLPNGEIIVEAGVWAMAYNPKAGHISSAILGGKHVVPVKKISEKEVIDLARTTFKLGSQDKLLIKPVLVTEAFQGTFRWKWAVKIDKMIKAKTRSFGIVESNQFLINPKIYLTEKYKRNESTDWTKSGGRFSILNIDVFGDRKNMKRLSDKTDRKSMLVKSFEIAEE